MWYNNELPQADPSFLTLKRCGRSQNKTAVLGIFFTHISRILSGENSSQRSFSSTKICHSCLVVISTIAEWCCVICTCTTALARLKLFILLICHVVTV